MYKLFKIMVIIACINFLPFLSSSCTHARPPKPGPNFVWVAPYTLPSEISIAGSLEVHRAGASRKDMGARTLCT